MVDIQRNILSIVILYKEEQYKIFRNLEEKHFTREYRTIFREMKNLYDGNREIDPLVISEQLGHEYDLAIVKLSSADYLRPNTNEYIKLLLEDCQRMEAKQKLKDILVKLEDKKQNLNVIKNEVLDSSKIFENKNDVRFRTYTLNELLTKILTDQSDQSNQIKTGFKKLDEHVIMSKSKFIIIGGRPSSGKTTMSADIAFNISLNYNTTFFSMETNPEGIAEKIIAAKGKIPYSHIINHKMTDEENTRYTNTANDIYGNKLGVINAAGFSAEEIRDKALQEKSDVIFVDYLQLINEQAKNSYERVTNISRKLQTLAKQENILVIALSQLKRPEQSGVKKPPTMSDLRESGQLEQDADAILLIYDESADDKGKDISKQQRILTIGKNKLGKLGDIRYDFYGGTQLFCEKGGC